MLRSPKVHILLAAHNRAHLITETLTSIINQTYTNFKCLIVDDYSTDLTESVVKEFVKKDSRFIYFHKTQKYKRGLPDTRNYGIDLALQEGAEFITFFDDDDIMHPRKLELQMQLFLDKKELDIVSCRYSGFSNSNFIDFDSKSTEISVFSKKPAEDFLLRRIRIHSCGPVLRSHLFKKLRFDTELKYNAEEREFYLRVLFYHYPNYAAVLEPLFYYRHHAKSITTLSNRNIEKRGTDIIVDQKLWDFISNESKINTRVLAYFIKQFALDNFDVKYLNKTKEFVKNSTNLNVLDKVKINSILKFHKLYRIIFYKLLQ